MSIFDDVWTVSVPCEACAPARNAVARFSIDFTVRSYGGYRGIHWLICRSCLSSCLEAAFAQHRGTGAPVLNLLPIPIREYT